MSTARLILPADLRHSTAAHCLAQLQAQIRSSPNKEVEIEAGQKLKLGSWQISILPPWLSCSDVGEKPKL
ncbi:MAG: hypothetical protein RIS60_2251 [Pseudomonadota bacterium]